MKTAVIALGANLGQPIATLRAAINCIAILPQTRLLAVSGFYVSEPLEVSDTQPDYFNAACTVATALDPHDLLDRLLAIESAHGRVREAWHAARSLDLDLIAMDELTVNSLSLTLPHPRAHTRAFVVLPVAEIAPWVRLGAHGPVTSIANALAGQRIRRISM